MNSDVLTTICTLLLTALKIGLVSRGEPLDGNMYIVYAALIFLFWGVMRSITEAMTGKKYIRGWRRAKVYREDTSGQYWFILIISVAINAYLAGIIFGFYMFN